jgi:hypothetical protein
VSPGAIVAAILPDFNLQASKAIVVEVLFLELRLLSFYLDYGEDR